MMTSDAASFRPTKWERNRRDITKSKFATVCRGANALKSPASETGERWNLPLTTQNGKQVSFAFRVIFDLCSRPIPRSPLCHATANDCITSCAPVAAPLSESSPSVKVEFTGGTSPRLTDSRVSELGD